jgi:hypothetical protein
MSEFRPFPQIHGLAFTTATGTTYEPGWIRLGMFGLRKTSPEGEVQHAECGGLMVDVLHLLADEKVEELEAYFK